MVYTQLHLDLARVRLQTHHQDAREAQLVRTLPVAHSPCWLATLLQSFRTWILAAAVPQGN